MKRKSLSSIFSTKIFGIILFIILGFFSLGIKNSEAKIFVEIVVKSGSNSQEIRLLMGPESLPKEASSHNCFTHDAYLRNGFVKCYSLKDINPALMSQIDKLVPEKILANQKKEADKLKNLFQENFNLTKTLSKASTEYSDSVRYLKDSLDWGLDMATKSYLSIYENLKGYTDGSKNVFQESDIDDIALKMANMYVYNAMTAYLTSNGTTLNYENIPQEAKDAALKIRDNVGKELSDTEKGASRYNFYEVGFDVPTKYPSYIDNPETGGSIVNPDGEVEVTTGDAICEKNGLWSVMNDPNCSVAAYLVNNILEGLIILLSKLVILIGELFDWVIHFSIYNFNDWVTNTKAYFVWKTVILSLVTSLLLPLVFYLLIRMLIDNDTSRIKQILPKVLITALFVYFSFAIVGWIIDQTNVLSIYIYRSMHAPDQTLGNSLTTVLNIDGSAVTVTKADWNTTLLQLIKVVINGVSLLVLTSGMILLFMRAIILLLVLIFSPLMLLPAGVNKYIDEYREKVIKSFTDSAISAPVFMFIVLIALKIGEAIRQSLQGTAELNSIGSSIGAPLSGADSIGASMASILIIVVLMLAITVSKKMSSDIGGQIAGKVNGFVGNVALGGGAAIMRGGVRGLSNNEKFQGWMKKNEGTSRGKLASSLMTGARNSTFDVRNTKGFQKASTLATGNANTFGKGTSKTVSSSEEAAYTKERKYHNSLTTEEGKKKNLTRLRNPVSGGVYGKGIADRLEGKNSGLTFKERVDNEKGFENKFNKANETKDINKRSEKLKEAIDEHYKDNGKGEKYFTQALEKPENAKFKKSFEEANKKTNEAERKETIVKTIKEFEELEKRKDKKEEIKEAVKKTTSSEVKSNLQQKISDKDRGQSARAEYDKVKEQKMKEGERRGQEIRNAKQMQDNISRMAKATEATKTEIVNMNKSFVNALKENNTSLIKSLDGYKNKAGNTSSTASNPEVNYSSQDPKRKKDTEKIDKGNINPAA